MAVSNLPDDAELSAALSDEGLSDGLERLRRLTKLKGLGTLSMAIETAERAVERSRKTLGPRYAEVERLLPAFSVWADERDRLEFEWDQRCDGCGHSFFPSPDREVDAGRWCALYMISERTCPEPCPGFNALKKTESKQ